MNAKDTEHYKEFKNTQRTNQGISSLSTQRANEKFCQHSPWQTKDLRTIYDESENNNHKQLNDQNKTYNFTMNLRYVLYHALVTHYDIHVSQLLVDMTLKQRLPK